MAVNFNVYIPLPAQDQDAPPVSNNKYIIVCDGLGASGSAKHMISESNGETQKSAYLGSRKLSETCSDFIEKNYDNLLSVNKIEKTIFHLKNTIKISFDDFLKKNPKVDDSKGGIVFPTTFAAAIFKEENDGINVVTLWAGDSRVYTFNAADGLMQLSKDDVEGEFDACFGKDCRMSNCVSQDDDFFINYAFYKLPSKSVLFACSDGCFDFKKSPMHFELDIVKGLFDATDLTESSLNTSLKNVISGISAGDDCTMAGIVFGYKGNELKTEIKNKNRPAVISPLIREFNDVENNYGKITDEKKREIRLLSSENRKLNQDIITQSKEFFVSMFKQELLKKSGQVNQELLELSSKTKQIYEPYLSYFSSLEKEEEQFKENQRLIEDCKTKFESLKVAVDRAERLKRVKEGKGQSYGVRILRQAETLVTGRPWFSDMNIYSSEKRKQEDLRRNCIMNIEQLEYTLDNLKRNLGFYSYEQMRDNLGMHFDNVLMSLKSLESVTAQPVAYDEKMLSRVLTEEELIQRVIPDIEQNGIGKYIGIIDEADYEALRVIFDEYITAKMKVSKDLELEHKEKSLQESIRDFENLFLKNHLFKMLDVLSLLEGSEKYISSMAQYKANVKKLNDIKNGLNSEMDAQRSVWSKYKTTYELYRKCECSGAV